MAKRHSKEHSRRKRASRSNGTTEKTYTGGRQDQRRGSGNAKHVKHSQADLTRAYQAWRRTSDARAVSIKFQEFVAGRPDTNPDYVPLAWLSTLQRINDRHMRAEQDRLEEERIAAEAQAQVLLEQEQAAAAPVKKARKPRAKKSEALDMVIEIAAVEAGGVGYLNLES